MKTNFDVDQIYWLYEFWSDFKLHFLNKRIGQHCDYHPKKTGVIILASFVHYFTKYCKICKNCKMHFLNKTLNRFFTRHSWSSGAWYLHLSPNWASLLALSTADWISSTQSSTSSSVCPCHIQQVNISFIYSIPHLLY